MIFFIQIFFILIFTSSPSFAALQKKTTKNNVVKSDAKQSEAEQKPTQEPSVLKADTIDGDQDTSIITAIGNVELTKGTSVVYSDKISYDKNNNLVKASGNIKMKDAQFGRLRAKEAQGKDDLSQGFFIDSTLVLQDGSYLTSPQAERKTLQITVLQNPVYSICPNPAISVDDSLAGKRTDLISIKSSTATIDQNKKTITAKHAFFRIYDIPILYTPYIRLPISDNKRKTGFLSPSYIKNNRFGVGFITPFFIDIAPNADLTIAPKIYLSNNQLTINSDFRHMVKYGEYNVNFEISDNKLTSNTDKLVVNRTKKEYRFLTTGEGKFVFDKNLSAKYKINYLGDRNYLRDYNYNFLAYTLSEGNLDYADGRTYYGANLIKIQELANVEQEKTGPLASNFNSYNETKPLFFKEKLALGSNFTLLEREDGLQYRRLSLTPEIKVPFNVKGNLFNINAKVQSDLYSLENNFTKSERNNNFNSTQTNYKPEFSATWRLPLIQKLKSNSFLLEPIASFVSSDYKKNYLKLPNEDSNNSELTVNNLFIADRIAGFDRNEAGERISYGVKSSLFNKFGKFGLTVGQSYRLSNKIQDVSIRGFNENNKSNIVGEFSYYLEKYFSAFYSFQLNESNYRNDVNSITTTLSLSNFTWSNTYLLLKKNNTNLTQSEQIGTSANIMFSEKFSVGSSVARDFVSKRTISRSISANYGGCCVVFSLSATENNSANLIKPQRSYKFNVTLRNM